MPRMPREPREIPIYFDEKTVGSSMISKIIQWYSIGEAPISRIVQRVRKSSARNVHAKMDYVDIYSILFVARKEKKVTDRQKKPYGELSLEDFATFFKAWKEGATFRECKEVVGRVESNRYCSRVFKSLNERYRAEKQANATRARQLGVDSDLEGVDEESLEELTDESLIELSLLRKAERRLVGNKMALVVYFEDIPAEHLDLMLTREEKIEIGESEVSRNVGNISKQ